MNKPSRAKSVAIDVMGADSEPIVFVQGMELVVERVRDVFFHIYGNEEIFLPLLKESTILKPEIYEFHHCDDVVSMNDSPLLALRRSRNSSSMGCAINAINEGIASATVSAGNTGALFGMAYNKLPTLPGISRPACACFWPTNYGECIVLDVGASTVQSAETLVQNAIMGSVLARTLLDRPNPKVALLNIGVEDSKGLDFIKDADKKLTDWQGSDLDYIGFVEPNVIMNGEMDVVISDGFTGNILLKSYEGMAIYFARMLKSALLSSIMGKIGAFIASQSFNRIKEMLDPRRRNGAMLIGLNGLVIKSHGSADALGIAAAIEMATQLTELDAVSKIEKEITAIWDNNNTEPQVQSKN